MLFASSLTGLFFMRTGFTDAFSASKSAELSAFGLPSPSRSRIASNISLAPIALEHPIISAMTKRDKTATEPAERLFSIIKLASFNH